MIVKTDGVRNNAFTESAYAMHETTRRRLLIAGVLLLSVAPAFGTAAWSVSRSSSINAVRFAEEVRKQVGLDVHIDSLSTPTAFTHRLYGVQLFEPGTDKVVVEFGALEFRQTENGIIVKSLHPIVVDSQFDRIIKLAHQRLLQSNALNGKLADFWCPQVIAKAGSDSQTLNNLLVRLRATEIGPQAVVSFLVEGTSPRAEPALVNIVHRNDPMPTTHIDITTSGMDVAGWLFSSVDSFGPMTRFNGQAQLAITETSRRIALTGSLANVDLDQLVGRRIGQQCSGSAKLGIKLARINNGQLEQLNATLSAGPGQIDCVLLKVAADRLGLVYFGPDDRNTIPYEHLGCQLSINGQGVQVHGIGGNSNVMMHERGRPILGGGTTDAVPFASVAGILAPNSRHWVPAEAARLMQHLPTQQQQHVRQQRQPQATARRPSGRLH